MLGIGKSLLTIFLQRGVPHRCAKPLPLQLDFVDDRHGPLLRHEDLPFARAETDYFFCESKKSCARRTEHETYQKPTGRLRVFKLHCKPRLPKRLVQSRLGSRCEEETWRTSARARLITTGSHENTRGSNMLLPQTRIGFENTGSTTRAVRNPQYSPHA
jgi:hypothetical protein